MTKISDANIFYSQIRSEDGFEIMTTLLIPIINTVFHSIAFEIVVYAVFYKLYLKQV